MIISPPFSPKDMVAAAGSGSAQDAVETDEVMKVEEGYELHHGVYPVAFDRRLHCGVHLAAAGQQVRAIADGSVVAYRVTQKADQDGDGLACNTGFVLLRHDTDTGDGRTLTFYSLYMHLLDVGSMESTVDAGPQESSPVALAGWLKTDTGGVNTEGKKKVYRKDMLGYMGQCHGVTHLHFEIFMTEEDFSRWFGPTQLGVESVQTPSGTKDYWGHTYFVMGAGSGASGGSAGSAPGGSSGSTPGGASGGNAGGTQFLSAPPVQHLAHAYWFPALADGILDANAKLYVEAYFHKGQRYTQSWIDRGDGKLEALSEAPEVDPCESDGHHKKDYEYSLYQRATELYPDCPSDGYELMRFGGRILSDATPGAAQLASKATWVAVRFEKGTGTSGMGYIDVNQDAVVKLSDADFPFFTGWKKIDKGAQPDQPGAKVYSPFDEKGLWDYTKLVEAVGVADTQPAPAGAGPAGEDSERNEYAENQADRDAAVSGYVHEEEVRRRLKGLVCHANSEWDSTPEVVEARYGDLNEADGYFGKRKGTDPDGYEKFKVFLKKFQFIEQTPLGGGKQF